MHARVDLVFPPLCDPTAPYLSLPTLAATLRGHGVEVRLIDANLDALEHALRRPALEAQADRVEARRRSLDRRARLRHLEQLELIALWGARAEAREVPRDIARALALLRGDAGDAFFDAPEYEGAVRTVDGALRLLSAAHFPLSLSFSSYRTPFALLDQREIARDAEPSRDPFHAYYRDELCAGVAAQRADLVGVSAAFPGQLQPAFAVARALRAALPDLPLVLGGPAATQLVHRLEPGEVMALLQPFDAVVAGEGEQTLLELVAAVERGGSRGAIAGVHAGAPVDLARAPAPDFSGLPLERYLSPRPVLPYDPSRGCYHGRCAFCHYGLVPAGTARYRERPVERCVEHLGALAARHGADLFYLSHDTLSPKLASRLSRALEEARLGLRFGSDARPEAAFDARRAEQLARGGCLSLTLGVESAAPEVLARIDKGVMVEAARRAVVDLDAAGVAVELMTFTGFPGETAAQALATARFVEALRDHVALFICGRFDLSQGSLVARYPERYGLAEVWRVAGDTLRSGLFYRTAAPGPTEAEQARVDRAVAKLARGWRLRAYPWAGSLSTAHSLLHYQRAGRDVFRRQARARLPRQDAPHDTTSSRWDLDRLADQTTALEAEAWHEMIVQRREVSPELYARLTRGGTARR